MNEIRGISGDRDKNNYMIIVCIFILGWEVVIEAFFKDDDACFP